MQAPLDFPCTIDSAADFQGPFTRLFLISTGDAVFQFALWSPEGPMGTDAKAPNDSFCVADSDVDVTRRSLR